MSIAQSKLTAQGQLSVPAKIRRKLGIGPGSVLEWVEVGEEIVVRRVGSHSSQDVHRAIFDARPSKRTPQQLREGIQKYIKARHAGR